MIRRKGDAKTRLVRNAKAGPTGVVRHSKLTQRCLLFSDATQNEQSLIISQIVSAELPVPLNVLLMSKQLRRVLLFCNIPLRHWLR